MQHQGEHKEIAAASNDRKNEAPRHGGFVQPGRKSLEQVDHKPGDIRFNRGLLQSAKSGAVLEHSLAAKSLLRPGEIICWHDYSFRFRHDVVAALDYLYLHNSENWDIKKLLYSNLSIYIKPDAGQSQFVNSA